MAQFNEHRDSVYCVDGLPVAPFNVFVSGDGADKAYVWRVTKNATTSIGAAETQEEEKQPEEEKEETKVAQPAPQNSQ